MASARSQDGYNAMFLFRMIDSLYLEVPKCLSWLTWASTSLAVLIRFQEKFRESLGDLVGYLGSWLMCPKPLDLVVSCYIRD